MAVAQALPFGDTGRHQEVQPMSETMLKFLGMTLVLTLGAAFAGQK